MPDSRVDPILLVEIGGTHTRCAVGAGDRPPKRVASYRNADHDNLESIVAGYLEGDPDPPGRAGLAIAAPADGQTVRLTNLGWTVDADGLAARFHWKEALLINDFEALACALPVLAPEELRTVRPGTAETGRPLAVLGPGTGLGVSALVPGPDDRWYPLSGEGGHVTLAAANDDEADILQALRREHGHVSAERVLSGPGLLALYRVLAGSRSTAASPVEVSRLAASGDNDARSALEQFFLFLGTVAADIALTLGARGGVYLGGGILPAMAPELMASGFARRFVDKGRFGGYLESIPVHLITAETPALRGIALHPRMAG